MVKTSSLSKLELEVCFSLLRLFISWRFGNSSVLLRFSSTPSRDLVDLKSFFFFKRFCKGEMRLVEGKEKEKRANHPHLQPVAELRRTQINVVKSKGILKAPSDHSLGSRLILRREENRRTRRKTLETRERSTITTLLT